MRIWIATALVMAAIGLAPQQAQAQTFAGWATQPDGTVRARKAGERRWTAITPPASADYVSQVPLQYVVLRLPDGQEMQFYTNHVRLAVQSCTVLAAPPSARAGSMGLGNRVSTPCN